MKKRKNKTLRRVITLVLLMCLVGVLTAMPLLARQEAQEEFPISILSAQVEQRVLEKTLAGGGSFQSQEALSVTVPQAVRLTEFLVKNGDTVAPGDPIAYVDRISVMQAISDLQQELESLSRELETARTADSTETLTAPGGLVKEIYCQSGDSVSQVMLERGCLALLSLDGKMMLTLAVTGDYSPGDSLTLTAAGLTLTATVESSLEGVLTVTVPDSGLAPGETARLEGPEGELLGEGPLEIHRPWRALAHSGTVDQVYAREGRTLPSGGSLLRLKDQGYSAEYRSQAALHREYEARMLELFGLYQDLTLRAPGEGIVSGIDENSPQLLSARGDWQLTLLKNAPGAEPDGEYINFVGHVTEIGADGKIIRLNPQLFRVTDYADLSAVPLDTALMTETVRYTSTAPVYVRSGESWAESAIALGDILLFAGDSSGNVVWAVKAGSAPVEQPDQPDQGETPDQPNPPDQGEDGGDNPGENPENPGDNPENPGDNPENPGTENPGGQLPSGPGFTIPSFGGSYSGGYPGAGQQEQETGLPEPAEVAQVTPTGELTLPITVDQQDIHHVALGQQVTVTAHALLGRSWTGTVTQISHIGENAGGSSKFTVTVTLPREADMLPGMHAAVTIPLGTVSGPAIPVAALVRLDGRTVVYTALDPKTGQPASPREVSLGYSDGEYVLLTQGLQPGDTLHYPYYQAETPRQ